VEEGSMFEERTISRESTAHPESEPPVAESTTW
jgi:hypothetical protein